MRTTINQGEEREAERGQVPAAHGRCWSLSHSLYGLLELRDVHKLATCLFAFTAPANEGVVWDTLLISF
jgi:hypothetical protein